MQEANVLFVFETIRREHDHLHNGTGARRLTHVATQCHPDRPVSVDHGLSRDSASDSSREIDSTRTVIDAWYARAEIGADPFFFDEPLVDAPERLLDSDLEWDADELSVGNESWRVKSYASADRSESFSGSSEEEEKKEPVRPGMDVSDP